MTIQKATPTEQVGATGKATADDTTIIPATPLNLQYSTFLSKTYPGITRQSRTWGYLVKSLEQPDEYASKEKCPLVKLATFGDKASAKGMLRHESNMLQVYGCEADYDGEQVSVDKAAALLEFYGIEAIIYTSPSHTEERPRWRVLAPLSQPYPVAERRRFIAMLNSALGGILAGESFTPAQCFFFGKVRGSVYRTRHVRGTPVDLNLVLPEQYPADKVAPTESKVAPAPRADLDELRERMHALPVATLTDYHTWLNVGMAAHHEAHGSDEGLDLWDEVSSKAPNYAGRDDLARRWDGFGQRTEGPLCTLTTLERLTGGAALLSDFDDVSADTDTPPAYCKFEVIPAAEFASGPPPAWIVRDVLPEAALCVIYGESASGKSFFVLDLVAAVARGEQWQGRKVKQGSVVYVAAEGAGGFRKRLTAFAQHTGKNLANLPIGVIDAAPNLLGDDDKALAQAVAAAGGASVIVVDTLAQSTPGGNENSSEDMGKAANRCKRLHEATGALVVLVHHSGKDASKGARGWSGLRAAVDAEIEITRDGERRQARITKQKDGEDAAAFPFCLRVLEVGHDADGFPVTSCVVDFEDVPAPGGPAKPLGKWELIVYDVVSEFALAQNSGIETGAVIAEAVKRSPPPEDGKRDTRKQRIRRALDTLCKGDEAPFFMEGDTLTVL